MSLAMHGVLGVHTSRLHRSPCHKLAPVRSAADRVQDLAALRPDTAGPLELTLVKTPFSERCILMHWCFSHRVPGRPSARIVAERTQGPITFGCLCFRSFYDTFSLSLCSGLRVRLRACA